MKGIFEGVRHKQTRLNREEHDDRELFTASLPDGDVSEIADRELFMGFVSFGPAIFLLLHSGL